MTTSLSNLSAEAAALPAERNGATALQAETATADNLPRTIASRFIILTLCLAIVLSTLAFGTVHSWSLAFFQAGAGLVVVLWAMDGLRSGLLRVSRNALQLPLLGLIALGLAQIIPLSGGGGGAAAGLAFEPVRSISLNPYATRLMVIHFAALLIYFAAALAFIDSPRRLRLMVRTLMIYGFLLAVFSMMQHFLNPAQIYWLREPEQAQPFGPFINRHHFAGYMELLLALPLGLLLAGAVPRDRILLYGFATMMMGFALILTNSRGGIVSLFALIIFLVSVSSVGWQRRKDGVEGGGGRAHAVMMRAALALGIMLVLFGGVLFFGGEASLSRLVGTVNVDDPTTGRLHFWRVTMEIIRDHPWLGAGLGAFSTVYTRYDTSNGFYRLEQAHNDYLQTLSDAGIVGAVLGSFFIVMLFRYGFARLNSTDKFRRGIALGALGGCFAVLVHSLFDFTLHTTSNALLFLVLAALATINGRVEEPEVPRRRRRKRRHSSHQDSIATHSAIVPAPPEEAAPVAAGASAEQG